MKTRDMFEYNNLGNYRKAYPTNDSVSKNEFISNALTSQSYC